MAKERWHDRIQCFSMCIGLFVLVFAMWPIDVQAKGDRKNIVQCPVCEAFRGQVTVETCTTSVKSTTAPFKTPDWKPQDLMGSKDLILRLENLVSYGDQLFRSRRDEPKMWEAYIQQKIDYNQGHLWAADVDIDNDGTPDRVMKYADGRCPTTTAWGTALFVLDASGTSIDVAKTEPIISKGYLGVTSEVVMYKGETFVLVWNPIEVNAVTILRFKNGRMEQMQ
jgi:hypothetical protein